MNENPLVAFVQTHVEMLLSSANHPVALPLPEELARHFLIGLKAQLLDHNDFVIRAKHEDIQVLQEWIRQNGVEQWFNIDNEVFRASDKVLQVGDKTLIINALQRLFPRQLHSTPGKLGMLVMKLRKRFCS